MTWKAIFQVILEVKAFLVASPYSPHPKPLSLREVGDEG
jgi:hypothetical protein